MFGLISIQNLPDSPEALLIEHDKDFDPMYAAAMI